MVNIFYHQYNYT